MAQKKTMQKKPPGQKVVEKKNPVQDAGRKKLLYILGAIVFGVSFIFYARSINNEYALDDGIVIEKNEYVHQGFAGIGDILTKDAYASFLAQLGSKGQLAGGRYRPLSIVTFAIEYQWFGFKVNDVIHVTGRDGKVYEGKITQVAPGGEVSYKTKEGQPGSINFANIHEFKKLAHFQHFINVLLFACSMVLLFWFLYEALLKELKNREYLAFFITLVFAMHPIHSEVVANIKSRDEILSFLFIMGTLIHFGRFIKKPSPVGGILTGVLFFMAMLSKEYAAVLFFIMPVWAYMASKKLDWQKMGMSLLPLVAAFLPYMALRLGTGTSGSADGVRPDVLNDPYLFATPTQKIATEIYILFKYLWLQLAPYPLASDYSFKTIAYRNFSSPDVILSIVVHLGLIMASVWAFIKKNWILTFAAMFYFLNLALVSNFIFDIGATMGERLVYNSSLGLMIVIFYGLYVLAQKWKNEKGFLYLGGAVIAILVVPYFIIVQERNAAWKNDYTLATTDVKTNSNSALLNANAGTYTINNSELFEYKDQEMEMTLEGKKYIEKALEVHPALANGWMNLAVIEHKLKNFESAEIAVRKLIEIFPSHPKVPVFLNLVSNDYINLGYEKYKAGKPDTCFYYLYKAKNLAPGNPEVYYNLGGAYLSITQNLDSAEAYFKKALEMNPADQRSADGLSKVQLDRK
jgi:tetratricopeptide (TPR) repeat protein